MAVIPLGCLLQHALIAACLLVAALGAGPYLRVTPTSFIESFYTACVILSLCISLGGVGIAVFRRANNRDVAAGTATFVCSVCATLVFKAYLDTLDSVEASEPTLPGWSSPPPPARSLSLLLLLNLAATLMLFTTVNRSVFTKRRIPARFAALYVAAAVVSTAMWFVARVVDPLRPGLIVILNILAPLPLIACSFVTPRWESYEPAGLLVFVKLSVAAVFVLYIAFSVASCMYLVGGYSPAISEVVLGVLILLR